MKPESKSWLWKVAGARLRDARLAAGLKQDEVAQAAGVSQSVVSKYERGSVEPDEALIAKIAGVLGRSVNWLYGLPEETEVSPHWTDKARLQAARELTVSVAVRLKAILDGVLFTATSDLRPPVKEFKIAVFEAELAMLQSRDGDDVGLWQYLEAEFPLEPADLRFCLSTFYYAPGTTVEQMVCILYPLLSTRRAQL